MTTGEFLGAAPSGRPTTLVVRTVEVTDPGPLLGLLPSGPVMSWVRRGEGLVGWGRAARFSTRRASERLARDTNRFESADAWWQALQDHVVVRDEVREPGTGPVAFGSFTFDPDSAEDDVLVVPEVLVGHRAGRWWVTTTTHGGLGGRPSLDPAQVPSVASAGPVWFGDGALSARRWAFAVAAAVDQIADGRLSKVVLARDVRARAQRPVDPRWVLTTLAARYPGCWTFAVDGLLGATPELLVRLERGLVHSRVLAGTIRRSGDDARDLALAASLARSSKDLEEHEYAVRSLAEALAPHCTSMNVPETPFVLHLPNVMHLATDVAGVLGDGAGALHLVRALHPTAAVGGTPTVEAVRVIAELEGMDRGRYAGPVGWIDANLDGEWGIALRCAQTDAADPRQLRLFAGCGIVAGSDPDDELAESEAKLLPMRGALAG
ncbi:MAG: isochorismate synthase [Angustibacter sp.]